jgi:DNA-binding response OmpR family regulator
MTARQRILIVDDDPVSGNLYAAMLDRAGFDVTVRDEVNLETLGEDRPDLVVLDLYMPNSSVWEMLPALRRRWPRGAVPVVMLSSEDNPAVQASLIFLGADDFLVKPIDAPRLIERVTYWIGQRSPA